MGLNADAWCNTGILLSVRDAIEVAESHKDNWQIVEQGEALVIAKFLDRERPRLVKVGDETGKPIRFATIKDARRFLDEVLSIRHADLYLNDLV